MVKIKSEAKVNTQSTTKAAAEVLSTFVRALMETVKAEAEPSMEDCPVFFKDLCGKEHNFKGINYLEAVIQSPLVEEGSGQLLCHPESTRTFAVRTSVRTSIPGNRLGEEGIREKLRIAGFPVDGGRWLNQVVGYGQPVISLATLNPDGKGYSYQPLETWGEIMPGVIKTIEYNWDQESKLATISVECLLVMSGDNEKYRGFGKARGNGGFLKNISIQQTGTEKLVFNPRLPLKLNNLYQQVEHVVGAEEYKVLNYLIGMLAHELDKIVWNALTGKWEGYNDSGSKLGEEELLKLLGRKAKRVEVRRDHLCPKVYEMFRQLYGEGGKQYIKGEFSFNDETCSITHHAAPAWIGLQTQIIETPLTLSFMGRTSLFAEHISYLGTEFPSLFGQLMEDTIKNSENIETMFSMAKGDIPGATEENPTGSALVFDDGTLINAEGEKWSLAKFENDDGGIVCEALIMPEGTDYNIDTFRTLDQKLKKLGYPAIVFESWSSQDEIGVVCIDLKGFIGLTGDVANKAFKNVSLLFQLLEVPTDERNHDWDAEFYRLVRMLQGALEFIVADSNALIAKATKTTKSLLTARRLGTLDASVAWDEIHAHPAFLEMFGINAHFEIRLREDGTREEFNYFCMGDYAVSGRVPVPGSATQKWVANNDVPFGVIAQNAALVHHQDCGDHDGDSGVSIVLDFMGNLKPIKAGMRVNPIAG